MKNRVIAISSPYIVIIAIVYALLGPVFFEMNDNTYGEEIKFVVDNKKFAQPIAELVQKECKSPCPESAEMCIEMCA